MLELREAHRHGEPQLSEEDIVVVFADDHPRSFWRLGRVERVITGADGQKRAATIRVSNKGHTSTLDRPIQHLYPMEIVAHTNAVSERDTEESDGDAENEPIPEVLEPRISRH